MATLVSERTITTTNPGMVSTVTYSYSRSGNTQYYSMSVGIRTNSPNGWWDDTWVVRIWANGNEVAHNLQVKGQTSGAIGYTWYYGNVDFSVNTSASSGTIGCSINYYTAGFGGSIDSQGIYRGNVDGQLEMNPLSVVSIALQSRTHNSITLTYSYSNIAPSHINLYNGSTYLGQYNTSPFTQGSLSANTTYGDLKAYGYANGGYGPNGNAISVKTYPTPVFVSDVTVSDITPFTARANVISSNSSFTNLIEYSLLDSEGTVVKSPITTSAYNYTFTDILPETNYQVRVRVRTSESDVWSGYYYTSFTTLTDQAQAWIKVDNVWRKSKIWIKTSGVWQPVKKLFIKVNNVWREMTNN